MNYKNQQDRKNLWERRMNNLLLVVFIIVTALFSLFFEPIPETNNDEIKERVVWTVIMTRDNIVEHSRVFHNYWHGANYADTLIQKYFPDQTDFPSYHKGERFEKDGLIIGVYKSEETD